MKKKILPAVWMLSVLVLGVLASVLSGESTHFFGIADDQEQTISFESPVEIVRTLVVEGEEVKQGDLLMEVQRENLNSNLAIVEDGLQELKSRHTEETATLKSRLISLTAKKEAQRAGLDSQIKSLQSRYELNKSFLAQLDASGSGKALRRSRNNPLLDEISSLRIQRRHLMESLQAEIDNIQSQLNTSERPINAQIAGMEDKKADLLRQVSNLQIRANFNGRVGSLLFKAGETVSPYRPILTVHSASPSYVKAYINENVVNKVKLGQEVWVQSSTSTADIVIIKGKVESLGSRIVEYPERLKKNKFVSAWGREVIVHLEQEHTLLLGEKVIVQLNKPGSMMATLLSGTEVVADVVSKGVAAGKENGTTLYSKDETTAISSAVKEIDAKALEASGILKDSIRKSYFVIGDEAKNGQPELYRINHAGVIIEKQTINMRKEKMPEIDDLESISSDGQYIYLMASLSQNKKDILKPKRRQLVRLQQTENEVIYRGSIDLYSYLEKLSNSSDVTNLSSQQFLKNAIASKNMDIEAHSIFNGDLYLGFKAPLNSKGESVIFKLNDVNALFSDKQTQGGIWRLVDLKDDASGEPDMLSDMLLQANRILLLSVKSGKYPVSCLWSYRISDNKLTKLATFKNLKAEGITQSIFNEKENVIVFDTGSKSVSRYLILNTEDLAIAGGM